MSKCPTINELSYKLDKPVEDVIAAVVALRKQGQLSSVIWEEDGEPVVEGNSDLAPEDVPTITAFLNKAI